MVTEGGGEARNGTHEPDGAEHFRLAETGRGSLVNPGSWLLVNPGNGLLEDATGRSWKRIPWKILETGQLEDDGISSPWDSQELELPVPGN